MAVWITDDSYLFLGDSWTGLPTCDTDSWELAVKCDSQSHIQVYAPTADQATATFEFLFSLLTTCQVQRISIDGTETRKGWLPVSGTTLSHFFTTATSLQRFTWKHAELNQEQCQALATVSRENLEIKLKYCTLANDAACRDAFVECLQADAGPTELYKCVINFTILAASLAGNRRVTLLSIPSYFVFTDDFFRALGANIGLVEMDLSGQEISTEQWKTLCQSLAQHPALTELNLHHTARGRPLHGPTLCDSQKKQKTRTIANMMRMNTVLHNVELSELERDELIYKQEIAPYLETNLHRSRLLTMKKSKCETLRRKLLGRSFARINDNSNLIWMFLSGNADVALPSKEELLAKRKRHENA
jgi:hypothetical protein